MEKVYKYYEITISEHFYRVHSDTAAQNNCYQITANKILRALS